MEPQAPVKGKGRFPGIEAQEPRAELQGDPEKK